MIIASNKLSPAKTSISQTAFRTVNITYTLKKGIKICCPYCNCKMQRHGSYTMHKHALDEMPEQGRLINGSRGKHSRFNASCITVPRMRCTNPNCPKISKGKKIKRPCSTHVIVPQEVIAGSRYVAYAVFMVLFYKLNGNSSGAWQRLIRSLDESQIRKITFTTLFNTRLLKHWTKRFKVLRRKVSYLLCYGLRGPPTRRYEVFRLGANGHLYRSGKVRF